MSERRWFFSVHALERMKAMEVSRNEVLATIIRPKMTYPGAKGHKEGRRVHVLGKLVVVTEEDKIVSVLWSAQEQAITGELLRERAAQTPSLLTEEAPP